MSQGGEMRRWRSFRVDQNGRAYDERYHAMTDAEMRAHARLNPLQQFVQMDDDVTALRERAEAAEARVTALESAAKLAQRWLALYARPNKELSAVTVALQGALAGSVDAPAAGGDDVAAH